MIKPLSDDSERDWGEVEFVTRMAILRLLREPHYHLVKDSPFLFLIQKQSNPFPFYDWMATKP